MRSPKLHALAPVCWGARLLLVYAFASASDDSIAAIGLALAVGAVAWTLFANTSASRTGFFGGCIYWRDWRPVHIVNYLLAGALTAVGGERYRTQAVMILANDLLLGITLMTDPTRHMKPICATITQ
jgi:hypothetical protein